MPTINILILLLLLPLSGCLLPPRVGFLPKSDFDAHRPPYEGKVEVLSAFPQTLEYETIGYLTAYDFMLPLYYDSMVLAEVQRQAAEYGANAIVVENQRTDGKVDLQWNHLRDRFDSPLVNTAVAIRILPKPVKEADLEEKKKRNAYVPE